MERQLKNISTDFIRQLVSSRGMLKRQPQAFAWEDAYEVATKIGQFIIPGFVIDNANRFAYENISKWIVNDPTFLCNTLEGDGTASMSGNLQKGLYLQGPTGTGKSICLSVFRDVARALRVYVSDGAATFPLAWMTRTADAICNDYEKDGDLLTYKREPILCINDLGAEPAETLHMGNRRNCIRLLIETRGDMFDKMTIFSSNIPMGQTGEFYGDRVQSRLVQMCNVITMKGKDRRYL